jgi:hypothetical protein
MMIIACGGVTKIELNMHLHPPDKETQKEKKETRKIMQPYAKT